jgi:glutamyl-tRNA reductase
LVKKLSHSCKTLEIIKNHKESIESLKKISEKNLQERHKELAKCEVVIDKYLEAFEESFHQRQIELAMRDVPLRMKKIKEKAFNEVFVKDIQNLDPKSREVLYKMFDYLEKKYISVPMKMAKEILIKK